MVTFMKNRRLLRLLITGSLGTTIFLINANGFARGPIQAGDQPATENTVAAIENPDGEPQLPPPPPPFSTTVEDLEAQIHELNRIKADELTLLPLPLGLLSVTALLLSLLSLLASFITYYHHRRSVSSTNKKIRELKRDSKKTQDGDQNSQYISENLNSLQATSQTFSNAYTSAAPGLDPPKSVEANLNTINPFPTSVPVPIPTPAAAPAQATPIVSKTGLISALNNGDRQQLRDASSAELNITDESENAIATGRSQATQLEEVSGGGSYWLICLSNQYWLFPTQRTLKGYTAAQPSKGLFEFEKRALSQAQLIEPACVERTGITWTVTSLGRIGTP